MANVRGRRKKTVVPPPSLLSSSMVPLSLVRLERTTSRSAISQGAVWAWADGAQQSAKACQDLSSLAFDLQNMVGTFKLGSGESDPPGTTRHSAVTARALAASAH